MAAGIYRVLYLLSYLNESAGNRLMLFLPCPCPSLPPSESATGARPPL